MTVEMVDLTTQILTAVGVIVSLIYVGYQVQQNTRMTHAARIESTVAAGNFVRQQIVSDADVADIYDRGNKNPHQLTDVEKIRYRILVHSVFWGGWNAHAYYQMTKLGNLTFDAQKAFLRRVATTPGGKWVWETSRDEFDADFREIMDALASSSPPDRSTQDRVSCDTPDGAIAR